MRFVTIRVTWMTTKWDICKSAFIDTCTSLLYALTFLFIAACILTIAVTFVIVAFAAVNTGNWWMLIADVVGLFAIIFNVNFAIKYNQYKRGYYV